MGSIGSTLANSTKSGAKAPSCGGRNVAAEAATHKQRRKEPIGGAERRFSTTMIFQISWTTLPGLRGLSCSEFRATPTAAPDKARGVAMECSSEAERDALLAQLEAHFAPQRFLNTAAAFDAVRDYVAQRAARG
jgi:hypothetical protein